MKFSRDTKVIVILFANLIVGTAIFAQKAQGIALKPPMGWNSWNCFRTDINEAKIKSIADKMVMSGMKDAGYEYVIIDDGWMTKERDLDGHIIVDSLKFPNGIKAVADYIHSLGLKFGIYSSPGCYTCQKLMGSLGYEQIDANDYAKWGVDFLKYDWCHYPKTDKEAKNTSIEDCRGAFDLMRDCLYKTGRSILYSVNENCSSHSIEGLEWLKEVAHMHRISDDIKDNWDRMLYCLEQTETLKEYSGPGHWNDPDMLEVGNTAKEKLWGNISSIKMTLDEYRTHFSMWCIVAAPLIAGNDLRLMKTEIVEILTNKELIEVDQDSLGVQGKRVRDDGDLEVWSKQLTGNRRAVALFNRSSRPSDITVSWSEIGLLGKLKVRDLWLHKNLGMFEGTFTGENIPPHEALIILVSN